MIRDGWIEFIIHTKLRAPAVYVRLKEPGLYILQREWTGLLKPQKRDKNAVREEVRKILEEARIVAERRMKARANSLLSRGRKV